MLVFRSWPLLWSCCLLSFSAPALGGQTPVQPYLPVVNLTPGGQYGPTDTQDKIEKIAEQLKPVNSPNTVDEWVLAIIHKNPDAFSKDAPSTLKPGVILALPTLTEVQSRVSLSSGGGLSLESRVERLEKAMNNRESGIKNELAAPAEGSVSAPAISSSSTPELDPFSQMLLNNAEPEKPAVSQQAQPVVSAPMAPKPSAPSVVPAPTTQLLAPPPQVSATLSPTPVAALPSPTQAPSSIPKASIESNAVLPSLPSVSPKATLSASAPTDSLPDPLAFSLSWSPTKIAFTPTVKVLLVSAWIVILGVFFLLFRKKKGAVKEDSSISPSE